MRSNKLKQMFRDRRPAIGVSLPFVSAEVVEFLGLLGFDFIFIDGEHSPLSPGTCLELVRAAEVVGVETIVRVPANDPHIILSYLETGALNIQVPHINTADEARQAVEAGRYPPLGTRGSGSGTRAADYGLRGRGGEYFSRANEEVMIIPMVEEPTAVENVEQIVRVPGLEAIFIGTGDLSLTMGHPGGRNQPDVAAAVERVENAVLGAGVALGGLRGDAATTNAMIERGYSFMFSGAGGYFAAGCRAALEGIKR